MKLSKHSILDYIAAHPGARREEIRRQVVPDVSETTVWRTLKRLVDEGKLEVSGKGPATGYSLAGAAVVQTHLQTPYNRRRPASYKKEFLDRVSRTRHSTSLRHTGVTQGLPVRLSPRRYRREPTHAAFLNDSSLISPGHHRAWKGTRTTFNMKSVHNMKKVEDMFRYWLSS
jgi:hypothetical protein